MEHVFCGSEQQLLITKDLTLTIRLEFHVAGYRDGEFELLHSLTGMVSWQKRNLVLDWFR